MFSSQRTALFTQDMVQAPLSRGHSYRSLFLQARERHINLGLWLSPCQKEPWITLTHIWPSQGVNSSRTSYGTTGSLYFQFLQVSIKSKKLAPDTSFFHHSFQTMPSSKQSHLYLLHKAMYLPTCHYAMVQIQSNPRHIKESQFLSSTQMLKTKQTLSLQKHIRSLDKGMT